MGIFGTSLTGAVNGLMDHAFTVAGGCFNNAISGGKVARRLSGRLFSFTSRYVGGCRAHVSACLGTSTYDAMVSLTGHYGGCVSRAVP